MIESAADFAAACASFSRAPWSVSRETLARLDRYAALLRKWQTHINLVGDGTLDDVWDRHFFDSAQLLQYMPGKDSEDLRVADLGTGAGFPGIVLAIMHPSIHAHLIESDQRKAGFLAAVCGELALPVTLHVKRIESVTAFKVDIVTARALAPLGRLLEWSKPFFDLGARGLFLKGENAEAELTDAQNCGMLKTYRMHPSLSISKEKRGGAIIEISEVPPHDEARQPVARRQDGKPPAQ